MNSACPTGWLVDQARINQFAECTGDRQWIHVDVERAKRESPFRGPIAHGYLTLSLIGSAVAGGRRRAVRRRGRVQLRAGQGALSRSGAGRRARPAASRRSTASRRRTKASFCVKTNNMLEIENSEKPALIAEALALLVPRKDGQVGRARDDESSRRDSGRARRRSRTRRRSTRLRSIRWSACAARTSSTLRKPSSRRRSASRRSPSKQWLSFLGEIGKIVAGGEAPRAPRPATNGSTIPPGKPAASHQRLLQSYLVWGEALIMASSTRSTSTIRTGSRETDYADPRRRPRSDERTDLQSGRPEEVGRYRRREPLVRTQELRRRPGQERRHAVAGRRQAVRGRQEPRRRRRARWCFATEVFELIQYRPVTPEVWRRPLVITPPQINKYLFARSVARQEHGPVPAAAGRPGVRHQLAKSDARSIATGASRPMSRRWTPPSIRRRKSPGSADVSLMGACSGGITSSAYTAWQACKGEDKVRNLILAVCTLDPSTAEDTTLSSLVTPETIEAARQASKLRGVLDGQELSKVFAWMRPNDLIWNYWVNNYLLGNAPPAFDILFWNSDTTSLPARLHSDFLDLFLSIHFAIPAPSRSRNADRHPPRRSPTPMSSPV